jgi:hypothetical protein
MKIIQSVSNGEKKRSIKMYGLRFLFFKSQIKQKFDFKKIMTKMQWYFYNFLSMFYNY